MYVQFFTMYIERIKIAGITGKEERGFSYMKIKYIYKFIFHFFPYSDHDFNLTLYTYRVNYRNRERNIYYKYQRLV